MSLESWKKEFYPMEADVCPRDNETMLLHSLLKWVGARHENLREHDMDFVGRGMIMGSFEDFAFNAITCALCLEYLVELDQEEGEPDIACVGCPLRDLQGTPCCYVTDQVDPYAVFLEKGDPEPMIEALKQCLAIEVNLVQVPKEEK